MLTAMPPALVDGMGMQVFSDMETLMKGVDFTGKDVYLMPYGGSTVPFLASP
ncbi:hypothetical protein SDC9_51402 [bioreactor metagenome]|uniref:Uncharacterized protein n=1 Tax=bioreactor metagenome TaxID=1076179 RepID=A0A644WMH5_9ZZZZ